MQFIYLFLSLYFGRKNPLYYLIFPFALSQGSGALIDTRFNLGMEMFLKNNSFKTISFVYLVFIFIYLKNKFKINKYGESIIHHYALYIVFLIISTLLISQLEYNAVNVIGTWVQMVVGFYSIRYIYICSNRTQFYEFINVMILVTSIQSILYCLNSSNIVKLFDPNMVYQELDFGNASFNRDFGTFPILGFLLYSYSLANLFFNDLNINKKYSFLLIASYSVALFLCFTRTLLASAAAIFVVIAFIRLFKRKANDHFQFRNIIIMGIIAFGLYVVILSYFPSQLEYLIFRFTDNKSVGTDYSYIVRMQNLYDAIKLLSSDLISNLFGGGLNKSLYTYMSIHGSWLADTTIPVLLIHTGMLGVLFYFCIEVFYIIRLIPIFNKEKDPLLIVLILGIGINIANETFAGGRDWGDPLIFHYQILASYLIFTYSRFNKNGQIKSFSNNSSLQ